VPVRRRFPQRLAYAATGIFLRRPQGTPERRGRCYDPVSMDTVTTGSPEIRPFDAAAFIPLEVGRIARHQTELPRIARDPKLTARIEAILPEIPIGHFLYCRDSRQTGFSQGRQRSPGRHVAAVLDAERVP
jgi:hypothetical protein